MDLGSMSESQTVGGALTTTAVLKSAHTRYGRNRAIESSVVDTLARTFSESLKDI
jgi:hypothetical protein